MPPVKYRHQRVPMSHDELMLILLGLKWTNHLCHKVPPYFLLIRMT